jgi:hypothetical protein
MGRERSVKDINLATRGFRCGGIWCWAVLSDRILKERNVSGIVSMDQINEVCGLTPEVVDKIKLSLCPESAKHHKK